MNYYDSNYQNIYCNKDQLYIRVMFVYHIFTWIYDFFLLA